MTQFCLGTPSRGELRVESARYSPAIGLVGAAAEQAQAAIIVQARGEQAMMLPPTQFKVHGKSLVMCDTSFELLSQQLRF